MLWLWCRPAAAAPTGPLAWEFPYATGAAIKKKKEERKKERRADEKPICGIYKIQKKKRRAEEKRICEKNKTKKKKKIEVKPITK